MGASWRILAHEGPTAVSLRSVDYDGSEPTPLHTRTIFDELVIDDFLHVEQMDTRHWWILVGNVLHVDVSKDARGNVTVSYWEDRKGGAGGAIASAAISKRKRSSQR